MAGLFAAARLFYGIAPIMDQAFGECIFVVEVIATAVVDVVCMICQFESSVSKQFQFLGCYTKALVPSERDTTVLGYCSGLLTPITFGGMASTPHMGYELVTFLPEVNSSNSACFKVFVTPLTNEW